MNERYKAIERRLQFATHDEMWLIRILRPASVQEVVASVDGIQENKPLSEHMNVDDLAYPHRVRHTKREAKKRTQLTILLGPIGDSEPQLVRSKIKDVSYERQRPWARWLR